MIGFYPNTARFIHQLAGSIRYFDNTFIFIVIVTFFPLAIGSSGRILGFLGIPIIWVSALLASLAGFERLFSQDVRDGWIDQVSLSNLEFGWYAIAKATTHWLATGLPLLIATPFLCLVLGISYSRIPTVCIALLLGSMAFTLVGIIGAALCEGAKRTTALMALIILPLSFPILIFGTLASANEDGIISPHLMLLSAVFLVLLALAPLVAAYSFDAFDLET